ncbi:MAG: hypothetical protein Q8M40_06630 [Legionella sp.]|nr:hypothetical protein [Legionella sp.]
MPHQTLSTKNTDIFNRVKIDRVDFYLYKKEYQILKLGQLEISNETKTVLIESANSLSNSAKNRWNDKSSQFIITAITLLETLLQQPHIIQLTKLDEVLKQGIILFQNTSPNELKPSIFLSRRNRYAVSHKNLTLLSQVLSDFATVINKNNPQTRNLLQNSLNALTKKSPENIFHTVATFAKAALIFLGTVGIMLTLVLAKPLIPLFIFVVALEGSFMGGLVFGGVKTLFGIDKVIRCINEEKSKTMFSSPANECFNKLKDQDDTKAKLACPKLI